MEYGSLGARLVFNDPLPFLSSFFKQKALSCHDTLPLPHHPHPPHAMRLKKMNKILLLKIHRGRVLIDEFLCPFECCVICNVKIYSWRGRILFCSILF